MRRRVVLGLALVLVTSGLAFAGQAPAAAGDVIKEVRAAIAKNDFAEGERILADYRKDKGTTPQALEALSWLGRGALAAKQFERAYEYARQTESLVREALKSQKLDADRWTPIALGASFEVQAHALANAGQRTEAITLLENAKREFADTSIVTRLQKNVHLLSLEGKPAPVLDLAEHLGTKPPPLASFKGKPVLMFFWAHWCPDCKQMAPVLSRLADTYGPQGLVVVGPTQRYGWVSRGKEASVAEEMAYIDEMRQGHYGGVKGMLVPVSEKNFVNWGSSTTPTVVLIDRDGVVRLYHPGQMTLEALEPRVREVVGATQTAAAR
jgi:thiol-disulfide isomerase/thioredoxin